MKMESIIVGIIVFLLSFTGGVVVGNVTAPKKIENIQNQYMTVENKNYIENRNENTQNSMQGQLTLIYQDSNWNYINLNVDGYTNITIERSTNSNIISVTNIQTNQNK